MLWMVALIEMVLFHHLQCLFKPTSHTHKATGSEGSSTFMITDKRRMCCQGMCTTTYLLSIPHVLAVTVPFMCFDAGVLCSAHTSLVSSMGTEDVLQFKGFGCINTLADVDEQHHD